jgi:energy-coupling factor transporter ATP-binding protein EcfA2
MLHYVNLSSEHQAKYEVLRKKFSALAILRLVLAIFILFIIWEYLKSGFIIYMAVGLILTIAFAILLKWHQKIKSQRNIQKMLMEINEIELNYLKFKHLPFENGTEFIDSQHLYTYDLDIFGDQSLFQHLNRTATPIGKKVLAEKLANPTEASQITQHQISISELAEKIAFRQQFNAIAKLAKLDKEGYDKVIKWSKQGVLLPSNIMKAMRIFLPILFLAMLLLAFLSENILFTFLSNTSFLLNLIVFSLNLKNIKKELIAADKIHNTLLQYAQIIAMIEKENFKSEQLIGLKKQVYNESSSASDSLFKLSKIFNNLDSMQNPVGAVLFNGALLYHLGIYYDLLVWKKKYASSIEKDMIVLGEFEALNSLANFSYNHPSFIFPKINTSYQIHFKELGHPLINSEKRVCNDIDFNDANFMILTGSNMSGKSTFLRTLGINMVLTNAGAPVCAKEANLHALPVIVSMRLSDSLTDSESYFFAEVKRLKQIMDELDHKRCFVLLDEILKGTNSDDKRMGTIKVVEKMVLKKAIGAIATHDLEVCNITEAYPNQLRNNCFEVEIVNDELVFDYKLRSGICKNKSATFLMNKMQII